MKLETTRSHFELLNLARPGSASTKDVSDPFSRFGGRERAKGDALGFWERMVTSNVVPQPLWNGITDYLIVPRNQMGERRARNLESDGTVITLPQALAAVSVTPNGRRFLEGCLPRLTPFLPSDTEAITLNFDPHEMRGPLTQGLIAMRSVGDLIATLDRLSYSQFLLWFFSSLEAGQSPPRGLLTQLQHDLPMEYSVTTFNLAALPWLGGFGLPDNGRLAEIGDDLRRQDSSFYMTQEGWTDSTEEVRRRVNYPYAAQRGGLIKSRSTGIYGLIGSSGLMILSKYPLIHVEEIPFPNPQGVEKFFVQKGILHARAATPHGFVDLYDIHAQSSYPDFLRTMFGGDEWESRREQLRFIRDVVSRRRERHIPCIAGGDLNVPEGTAEYNEFLKAIGVDLYRARHPYPLLPGIQPSERELGITFDSERNPLAGRTKHPEDKPSRLDYLLGAGEHFERDRVAFHTEVVFRDRPKSDHYGVRARFVRC